MLIVKITVLLWVIYLIVRYFVRLNVTNIEKLSWTINRNLKWTFGRVIVILLFFINVLLTVISLIWFLFFSGII